MISSSAVCDGTIFRSVMFQYEMPALFKDFPSLNGNAEPGSVTYIKFSIERKGRIFHRRTSDQVGGEQVIQSWEIFDF